MSEEYLKIKGFKSLTINDSNSDSNIIFTLEFIDGVKYNYNITEDFDKIQNNNYNYYSFIEDYIKKSFLDRRKKKLESIEMIFLIKNK